MIEPENTYWYHGSKKSLQILRKQNAQTIPGRPLEESLDAIYFTPDLSFALVCAVRPPGITEIDFANRTILFGYPDLFQPEESVYIYLVRSSRIPEDKIIWIDEMQVAVLLDEIKPDMVKEYKSSDVLKYFRIID